jgi:prepilin peptidase CpaA
MGAELLVIVVLPSLLALAAGWDLASYTIPNALPLALFAAFLLFVPVAGITGAAFAWHLAAGLVGLAAGFALFASGFIGGGDAKLFAAVALWFGFADLASYALIATVIGGALTLLLLALRQLPLPVIGMPWLRRLADARSGIPYGVALAAGALAVLPQTEVFRLATAS